MQCSSSRSFILCQGDVSLDTTRHLLQALSLRSAWCARRLDVVCRGKRPLDTHDVVCRGKRPLDTREPSPDTWLPDKVATTGTRARRRGWFSSVPLPLPLTCEDDVDDDLSTLGWVTEFTKGKDHVFYTRVFYLLSHANDLCFSKQWIMRNSKYTSS